MSNNSENKNCKLIEYLSILPILNQINFDASK